MANFPLRTMAGVLGLCLFAGLAQAEEIDTGGYSVDTLTFERWCSEIRLYSAERCAARSAADLEAFEITRRKIEQFEVEHARDRRQDREFRQTFSAHETYDRNRRFDF